jgi:hypothetical protein
VVPGAAVKPNRARVSTTRPVLAAGLGADADLVLHVPLHGALGDAERVGLIVSARRSGNAWR